MHHHGKTVKERDKENPGIAGTCHLYLPGILMHEFGHAIGLADLGQPDDLIHPYGYVLMTSTKVDVHQIPDFDIYYLRQFYHKEFTAK